MGGGVGKSSVVAKIDPSARPSVESGSTLLSSATNATEAKTASATDVTKPRTVVPHPRCSFICHLSESNSRFGLVVIGAGPAGVKAATEAASRGQRVALIESKQAVTGAPTGAHSKCLREAALAEAKNWKEVEGFLERATARGSEATARELMTYKVELLKGAGFVLGPKQVRFTPDDGSEVLTLDCDALIIATGSRANRFPPVPFDKPGCFDSDTISKINYCPKKVVVQGGGIVGLEYGLIFAKLGAKVVVVNNSDRLVPMLDLSLQEACVATMKKNGVEILLKTPLTAVEEDTKSTAEAPVYLVKVGAEGSESQRVLECDCVLSATGRQGVTDGIGLENLPEPFKIGRNKMVEVDKNNWTGLEKVYAIGDVAAGNLATIGQAHAIRAVRTCFGSGSASTGRVKDTKPSGVWTIPEIAWAGMTEEAALKAGHNVGKSQVSYLQTVRGCLAKGEEGFMKMVYDRDTGKVLGVHIFGEMSCDIINYGAEIVNDGDSIFDILQFVFPAVTYHELYHLAATEAKVRLSGCRDLKAATMWQRVKESLNRSMERSGSTQTVDEAMEKAFRAFDPWHSGFLDHAQLKQALARMGMQLSDEEIKEMILEATSDPTDVKVDYEQFLTVLRKDEFVCT